MIDLVADRVAGYRDMRKSIDGLAAIVKYEIGLDPLEPEAFAFCGRRRDRIKLLYWDVNGFWLLYKRLENGCFRWPTAETDSVLLTRRQLAWLLDGLHVEQRQTRTRSNGYASWKPRTALTCPDSSGHELLERNGFVVLA